MPRSPTVPSYRRHKPTGQAVVTIRTADGARRDVYLGKFNSSESRAEYGRLIAELAASPIAPPAATLSAGSIPVALFTVDQLVLAFLKHADRHYRDAEGNHTDQFAEYKSVVRPLHTLYGTAAASAFGPLALKVVRQVFVDAGNARTVVNSRVGKIKRLFKWAVSEQLVPVITFTALQTVAGLQKGRTEAKEKAPITPVVPWWTRPWRT